MEKDEISDRVIDKCREILEVWRDEIGPNPINSYAREGLNDINSSLDSLNDERREVHVVTSNLWDAGYNWDHRAGRYSLRDLREMSDILYGFMSEDEFFKKFGE